MKSSILVLSLAASFTLANSAVAQKSPSVSTTSTTPPRIPSGMVKTLPTGQTSTTMSSPNSPKRPSLKNLQMGGGVVDGGGGDEVGLSFQAEAARAALRLKAHLSRENHALVSRALETVNYIVLNEQLNVLSGFGHLQSSIAVNVPEENTVYIQRDRWNALTSSNRRQAIAAHELLSLVGLEKTGDYSISSKLETESNLQGVPASKQILLYERYYNNDPIGLTSDSAGNICSNKKEEFGKKYYFVYCSYLEKTIVNPTRNPRRDEVSTVYGLRVYGIGERENLQWKTVFNSLAYGPGGSLSATYETHEDAMGACLSALRNSFHEEMWTEPRCAVLLTSDEQFYFHIQTQNPLLD